MHRLLRRDWLLMVSNSRVIFQDVLINNCTCFNRGKGEEYFLEMYQWKEPAIYENR